MAYSHLDDPVPSLNIALVEQPRNLSTQLIIDNVAGRPSALNAQLADHVTQPTIELRSGSPWRPVGFTGTCARFASRAALVGVLCFEFTTAGTIRIAGFDQGFKDFRAIAMNNSGTVAFIGVRDGRLGVYTGTTGLPKRIAEQDTSEPMGVSYPQIGGSIDINNKGEVAFTAIRVIHTSKDTIRSVGVFSNNPQGEPATTAAGPQGTLRGFEPELQPSAKGPDQFLLTGKVRP